MIGSHELKECKECGETKPLDEFYKIRPQWEARSNFCKPCYSARVQRRKRGESVGDKPVLLAESEKSGVKICRTCGIGKSVDDFYFEKRDNHHQPDCKSCVSAKHRIRWAESRTWKTQKRNEKFAMLPEEEQHKLLQQRRYNSQRKLNLRNGTHAGYEGNGLELVLERDKQICYLCDGFVELADLEFDHVIPLSRGGLDTIENIKVTHRWCNRRKHRKLPGEYVS